MAEVLPGLLTASNSPPNHLILADWFEENGQVAVARMLRLGDDGLADLPHDYGFGCGMADGGGFGDGFGHGNGKGFGDGEVNGNGFGDGYGDGQASSVWRRLWGPK